MQRRREVGEEGTEHDYAKAAKLCIFKVVQRPRGGHGFFSLERLRTDGTVGLEKLGEKISGG